MEKHAFLTRMQYGGLLHVCACGFPATMGCNQDLCVRINRFSCKSLLSATEKENQGVGVGTGKETKTDGLTPTPQQ